MAGSFGGSPTGEAGSRSAPVKTPRKLSWLDFAGELVAAQLAVLHRLLSITLGTPLSLRIVLMYLVRMFIAPIPEIFIAPIPEMFIAPIPEIFIAPIPEIFIAPIPEIFMTSSRRLRYRTRCRSTAFPWRTGASTTS